MKDFPQRIEADDVDPLLSLMLGLLPTVLTSFGLTATIDGVIVSGLAIDQDRWIDEWVTKIEQAGEGGVGLGMGFRGNIKEYGGTFAMTAELAGIDSPSHLHLKDAVIFSGPTSYKVAYYRAQLNRVSGWSMGQMGDRSSDQAN